MLLALLAALRGRMARAAGAVAVVVLTVGSVELLKHGLRHVAGAVPPGREPSFPSGHTSVAASLGAALVLAAPPVARPLAALSAAAYAAGIGLSVIVVGAHYPSDVVGSFLVCGFWSCLVAAAVGARPQLLALTGGGAVAAVIVVAAGLALAVAIASRHPAAVATLRDRRTLVATAAALGALSLATFGALTVLVAERGR